MRHQICSETSKVTKKREAKCVMNTFEVVVARRFLFRRFHISVSGLQKYHFSERVAKVQIIHDKNTKIKVIFPSIFHRFVFV